MSRQARICAFSRAKSAIAAAPSITQHCRSRRHVAIISGNEPLFDPEIDDPFAVERVAQPRWQLKKSQRPVPLSVEAI